MQLSSGTLDRAALASYFRFAARGRGKLQRFLTNPALLSACLASPPIAPLAGRPAHRSLRAGPTIPPALPASATTALVSTSTKGPAQ